MTNFPFSTPSADQFLIQINITAFCQLYDKPVNQLLDAAFGVDRQQKSSYKLRESCQKIDALSFVLLAKDSGEMLASIAYWQLDVAGEAALLLGPLAVNPTYQGQGLGKYLMDETLKLAKSMALQKGWKFTILIGDLDYYQKSGFKRVPLGAIDYPEPTDPLRVLCHEFEQGSLQNLINQHTLPLKLNQSD